MKEEILEWLRTNGFHYRAEARPDGSTLEPILTVEKQRELMEHLRNFSKKEEREDNE